MCVGEEESLCLQLGRLLKELHCPHEQLVCRILKETHSSKDLLQSILFLCSELQAARIIDSRASAHTRSASAQGPDQVCEELRSVCHSLQFTVPQEDGPNELFRNLHTKVESVLSSLPRGSCGPPVLKSSLSSEQWDRVSEVNQALSSEYECRRRMLIKRLDVTIQSFGWSDRAKMMVDHMARVYQPLRHSLRARSSVDVASLLAAREDLCHMEKTCSGSSRQNTSCAVNKVLMGRVPDRGGRPSEIQAPPPEMPPWQKRQDGGGWGGRGGRGGGWGGQGGRGGRGGGGWNHGHGGRGGHGGKRGRYQY
ncbi:unnamed protein product [Knipowitschia caucasica]|uniref:Family with sequence similarity 98 member B n=1 Tax=Knipowitschia caucasica TaxID=637954 RepID=A0AAV2JHB4_KNICA